MTGYAEPIRVYEGGVLADPLAGAYRMLLEQAQVALFVLQHGRFVFVNAKLCELSGYTRAELLHGGDPFVMVAPEHRAVAFEQTALRLSGVPGRPYSLRCMRKDGTRFSARITGNRIDLGGAPANLVTLHDVSELERATLAEQRRSRLVAQTEELALIGSSEFDVATGMVTQSAGMFRVFGEPFSEAPVSGEWLMERVPRAEDGFVRGILACVQPGVPCEFEHRIQHRDGSLRTVLHRTVAETDDNGRVNRVIGIVQDITAQRAAEHQRDLLARSDAVTRLPNRAALLEHVDLAIAQSLRQERRIALLMVEIGQVQLVSESLGYAAGDQLLLDAAERLATCLDTDDLLAHVGSGRFALVLARRGDVDEAVATAVAQAAVAAFVAPLPVGDTDVRVRCAVGIALCPRDGRQAEQLLHQAEAAMRKAQDDGGGGVRVYALEVHAGAARRLTLEAALRRALEREEFHLVYQPQLDLGSGALTGVEALLRWNDPSRGIVPPDEFIPLAEESGLILPLGDWVLRAACAQAAAWQHDTPEPLRVAVNLSVLQLQQQGLADRIRTILRQTGLDPRRLGLEITETTLMQEHAQVARTLAELHALGVEISLDDFGTGYSNLGYLRTLPIDVLKVDRSFVHDVTVGTEEVSMTRAVITMAHSLRKKVLAEGVETDAQLTALVEHGCDQMQGYLFSRPVLAADISAMRRAGRRLERHRTR